MADKITDINDILREFCDVEFETLADVYGKAGLEAAKELKATSPKKYGSYARSWRVKRTTKNKGGAFRIVDVKVYSSVLKA